MRTLSMLWVLFRFEGKRYKAYPTEIVAVLVGKIIELTIIITFWSLVAKYSGNISFSINDIVSFYLIINGISTLFATEFGVSSTLIKLVRYGELNQILVRPINPFLVPYAQFYGRKMLVVALAVAQIGLGIGLSNIQYSSSWFLLPLVLFNTAVINLAFNLIIGSFSFYMGEANGIKNSLSHVNRLLGGNMIPLFLMPASIATALQFTPFPAAQYHLTILLQGQHPLGVGFVFIGTVWAVVLAWASISFWRFSLGRYDAVGA